MPTCETCKYWYGKKDRETGAFEDQGTCINRHLVLVPAKKGPKSVRALYDVGGPDLKVGREFGCIHYEKKG